MSRYRRLLTVAAALSLVVGCAADQAEPTEEDSMQGQHHTMDPEGGLTFDEQIQELEAATAAVQKHLGDDVVARFGTDTFSPAAVKERALPQVCEGSGYHLQITFDIAADRDLQELYDQAAAVAAELGLSENSNNSDGVNERGGIFYGAGRAEGRIFVVTKRGHQDRVDASFHTRCSDDPSMEEQYQQSSERGRDQIQDEYGIPGQ